MAEGESTESLAEAQEEEAEASSVEDLGRIPSTCPTCGKGIYSNQERCPHCGENFLLVLDGEEVIFDRPVERYVDKPTLLQRILFWSGLLSVVIGGPGMLLFSFGHNVLNVPSRWGGSDVCTTCYGPIDRMFSSIGLVLLVLGILFILLSLRTRKREVGFVSEDKR